MIVTDESTAAGGHSVNLNENLPYNIAIYVPCHFDFSQLEYVAPFFERFPGSKVFIYKWHGLRDKIREHYLSEEYQACNLGVYEFSLQTLVSCILREDPSKKIVFLLTASMAYRFGSYQKQLLLALKDLMPDRIWGVSVVGHCMYGCMSCKGVDHLIPVYFTRYFKQKLTYTAETVRQQYLVNPKAKPVLVAPSTGETTMILHKSILELLLRLQTEGKYEFVFKLHPACFNMGDYDMTYSYHIQEVENLKFIFANFKVTSERQPCLLPFYEAFDTILCDLHSSVGFMASYFAPRVIIAYHNDAHYEVPERDPKFLANLNIFDEVSTLEKYLTKDTLIAKGSPEFFYQKYGKVDGNEIDRFAALAKWPRSSQVVVDTEKLSRAVSPVSLPFDWRKTLRLAVDAWKSILKSAIDEMKIPDPNRDEVFDHECKLALGISTEVEVKDGDSLLLPKQLQIGVTAGTSSTAATATAVNVMSLNMWHGGEAHPAHHKLDVIAQMIVQQKVDIVGLQEAAGMHPAGSTYPPVDGKADLRVNKLEELAKLIGKMAEDGGKPWHFFSQGIVTPGRGNIQPWGIISRWPITAVSPNKWGVQIETPNNRRIWLFNIHLPYFPYQPYQLCGIPYEDAPPLFTESETLESSNNCRGSQMDSLLSEIKQIVSDESKSNLQSAYFVTGDFNEPSHQDWSLDSYIAGVHPIVCRWPNTEKMVSGLGFSDAYRVKYPDEVIFPGFTWAPRKTLETNSLDGLKLGDPVPNEHHDRIDFVFAKGQAINVDIVDASIVGARLEANHVSLDQGVVGKFYGDSTVEWPSDHRAVVANYLIY